MVHGAAGEICCIPKSPPRSVSYYKT